MRRLRAALSVASSGAVASSTSISVTTVSALVASRSATPTPYGSSTGPRENTMSLRWTRNGRDNTKGARKTAAAPSRARSHRGGSLPSAARIRVLHNATVVAGKWRKHAVISVSKRKPASFQRGSTRRNGESGHGKALNAKVIGSRKAAKIRKTKAPACAAGAAEHPSSILAAARRDRGHRWHPI